MKKCDIDNYVFFKSISLKDMWKWNYLEQTIHKTMNFFNYKEIRPPFFLSETIISKVFSNGTSSLPSDFYQISNCNNVFLRPDGTLTNLFDLFNTQEVSESNLVYYIGPMFRRNKKDAASNGQFYQFGAEAIGIDSHIIDVETIRLGLNIFKKFGLANIRLEVSSFGCPDCRPEFNHKLFSYWQEHKSELCSECSEEYGQFVNYSGDCQSCSQIWMNSPSILNELCDNCANGFNRVKRTLANLMLDFVVNPHLNMNFPYYNQLVFQYKTLYRDSYLTIGGGGRYDNLVNTVSGRKLPAVGFSANIETLITLLDHYGLLPETELPFQIYIMATNTDLETTLLQIVQELRDNEIKVIIGKTDKNYDKQMALAQNENCSFMIIISDEAIREGKVYLNNLVKRHKETIYLKDLLSSIQRLQKTLAKN